MVNRAIYFENESLKVSKMKFKELTFKKKILVIFMGVLFATLMLIAGIVNEKEMKRAYRREKKEKQV